MLHITFLGMYFVFCNWIYFKSCCICSLCKSSNLVVYHQKPSFWEIGSLLVKSQIKQNQQNSYNIKNWTVAMETMPGRNHFAGSGRQKACTCVEDSQRSTGLSVAMALFRLPNECDNSAGKHATTSKNGTGKAWMFIKGMYILVSVRDVGDRQYYNQI
jgi:hypothetical protein